MSLMDWLHTEHLVTFTATALASAASYKHKEALLYLITSQGLSASVETWRRAVKIGSKSGLKLLYEHCDHHFTPELYLLASPVKRRHGKALAIVRWLHEMAHCFWEVMPLATKAALASNVSILKYMKQNGASFSVPELTDLLECAGMHAKDTACLQWLRDAGAEFPECVIPYYNDCGGEEGWTQKAMDWAESQGCKDIDWDYEPGECDGCSACMDWDDY